MSQRLGLHHSRVTLVDGLFSEAAKLSELVSKVDLVYINAMENPEDIRVIATILEKYPKVKLIGASMPGLHAEVLVNWQNGRKIIYQVATLKVKNNLLPSLNSHPSTTHSCI